MTAFYFAYLEMKINIKCKDVYCNYFAYATRENTKYVLQNNGATKDAKKVIIFTKTKNVHCIYAI